MTFFQSILLGIVQGLTEFLPISSSGHLVIVPYILGWDIPPQDAFIFDVLVQVATIAAVIAYFWSDLLIIARALFQGIKTRKPMADPNSQLGIYILIATLPAGLIGFVFKDLVEQAFNSPIATGFFLLVTAALLFLAERASNRRHGPQSRPGTCSKVFFSDLYPHYGRSRRAGIDRSGKDA
jgi:undecaprenyl-diphosphatase